ncbi:hypothetical protein SVIOM74S_00926 [Streptomyces violarus]
MNTTLAAIGSLGSMGGLFSTTVLYSIGSGVAVGGGLALLLVAVRGLPAKPDHEKQKAAERASELIRFAGQRGSLAAIVGLVVLLLTRWAVAGIAAGVLVFFWDRLFGGAGEERAAMRRVEALASWTESLRDTIAGAVGLEQAIPASARAAAPVLRPHLDALVDRLRARTPLPEALQHLADEIDDASADIIVAALILNARLRGSSRCISSPTTWPRRRPRQAPARPAPRPTNSRVPGGARHGTWWTATSDNWAPSWCSHPTWSCSSRSRTPWAWRSRHGSRRCSPGST